MRNFSVNYVNAIFNLVLITSMQLFNANFFFFFCGWFNAKIARIGELFDVDPLAYTQGNLGIDNPANLLVKK